MRMSQTNTVPLHVGLILDGNRRWAKERGLQPMEGHREGVETLKAIVRYGFDAGVHVISAFVFSTENWKRSKTEVSFLMNLILKLFKSDLDEFIREGYRVVVLGSRDRMSSAILRAIDETEARTRDNTKGIIALCINYSSTQELADAAATLAEDVRSGNPPKTPTEYLYHPEIPELDLIVRTSGEHRLSGFMLPRASYAELAFVDTHWPAFSTDKFQQVLDNFADRKRRFGA